MKKIGDESTAADDHTLVSLMYKCRMARPRASSVFSECEARASALSSRSAARSSSSSARCSSTQRAMFMMRSAEIKTNGDLSDFKSPTSTSDFFPLPFNPVFRLSAIVAFVHTFKRKTATPMIFVPAFAALGSVLLLVFGYQQYVESCMTSRPSDLQYWASRLAIPSLICWIASLICTAITGADAGGAPALEVARDFLYDCGTLGGFGMIFFVVLNTVKNSWLVANVEGDSSRVETLQWLLVCLWVALWCVEIGSLAARAATNRNSYSWLFLGALALSLVITMGGAWVALLVVRFQFDAESLCTVAMRSIFFPHLGVFVRLLSLQMRTKLVEMAQTSSAAAAGDTILDRLVPFYRFMGLATVLLAAAAAFQALGAVSLISSADAYYGRAMSDFDPFNFITLIAWLLILYFAWKNKPTEEELERARHFDRNSRRSVSAGDASTRRSVFAAASVVPADAPTPLVQSAVVQGDGNADTVAG